MKYKITTKSGKVYKATTIDYVSGFLKMECWDGEHRIPAAEVAYIRNPSARPSEISEVMVPLFLFTFVFGLALMLLF